MERWLHRHLFKVGWLVTQNYQTTTIFYYAFFLPGVILHEVVYWLSAGMLNVGAEREIKFPEEQQVAELKLSFIKLERRANPLLKGMIAVAPLIVGMVVVWLIATNMLNISGITAILSNGDLNSVGVALGELFGTADFWLWFYIIFTVSNTMFPAFPKDLQGWRPVLLIGGGIFLILFVIGVGTQLLTSLQPELLAFFSSLEAILLLLIAIDFIMVAVLGTIEYAIESTTGRSATFRRGRLETRTRAEMLEERRRARDRERRKREQRAAKRQAVSAATIYALPLPIAGLPSEEPITRLDEPAEQEPAARRLPLDDSLIRTGQDRLRQAPLFSVDRVAEEDVQETKGDEPTRLTDKPTFMPPRLEPKIEEDESADTTDEKPKASPRSEPESLLTIEHDETETEHTEKPSRPAAFKPRPPTRRKPTSADGDTEIETALESTQPVRRPAFTPAKTTRKPDDAQKAGAPPPSPAKTPTAKPQRPAASISPFSQSSKRDDGKQLLDDIDNATTPAATTPRRSLGIKPFSDDKNQSDDKAGTPSSTFKITPFSAPASHPATKTDDAESETSSSGRFKLGPVVRRPNTSFAPRTTSRSAAPEDVDDAFEDTDDELEYEDDELEYEDVEDDYYDDDDYIDYDDI